VFLVLLVPKDLHPTGATWVKQRS